MSGALGFLSEPATLASLAAVAAASMVYITSRPTPLKCPVNPKQQSIEVPVRLHTTQPRFEISAVTVVDW